MHIGYMYLWSVVGFYIFIGEYIVRGTQMEQPQSVGILTAFMQQMRQNKFFLLTVLLGTVASIYFIIGLVALIGH